MNNARLYYNIRSVKESWLFAALLVLTLLPIWLFPWFLTADGPCHLYNAAILRDWMQGNGDFYSQFYDLNTRLEPNWLTHTVLALLQFVFIASIANKLFLSTCIILFCSGFRKYLFSIAIENRFLSIWIFPFVWQTAMLMGFYNYMLSIGLAFCIAAFYTRHKDQISTSKTIYLMLSFVLLYFTHLLGCFMALMLCGLASLQTTEPSERRRILPRILKLTLTSLPAIILTLTYLIRQSDHTSNAERPALFALLNDLNMLSPLFGLTGRDVQLSMKMSFMLQLLLLFVIAMLFLRSNKKNVLVPGISFIIILLLYLFLYETSFGGSQIRPRLGALLYMFIILCAASIGHFTRSLRFIFIVAAIIFSSVYSLNKISAYRKIDLFVSEMRSAGNLINDRSLVLPLNCDRFLHDTDGNKINLYVPIFTHVAEILQEGKQLIFLNNYQASTGYFPTLWKENLNPFVHLAINQGMEVEPPQVDILKYNKENATVNYILIWGNKKEAVNNPAYLSMVQTVVNNYTLIYTSEIYKIKLYRFNSNKTTL